MIRSKVATGTLRFIGAAALLVAARFTTNQVLSVLLFLVAVWLLVGMLARSMRGPRPTRTPLEPLVLDPGDFTVVLTSSGTPASLAVLTESLRFPRQEAWKYIRFLPSAVKGMSAADAEELAARLRVVGVTATVETG